MDRLAFGGAHEGSALFVDEYELLARHDREKTGSPDQAVLWPDRVLIIELKTERLVTTPGSVSITWTWACTTTRPCRWT